MQDEDAAQIAGKGLVGPIPFLNARTRTRMRPRPRRNLPASGWSATSQPGTRARAAQIASKRLVGPIPILDARAPVRARRSRWNIWAVYC